MNILFKNVRIINPAQNLDMIANLWIKDGIIKKISQESIKVESDTQIINEPGLVVSPGLFDMHVHFRDPGYEQKEDLYSGTEAAANGGFTGVVVMPNTNPTISDKTVVEYIKSRTKNSLVDVFISGSITKNLEGKHISNMLEMYEAGVVLFTDDGKCVTNTEVMRRAFDYATPKDLLISQHCEDTSITDNFDMNESEYSVKLGLKGYPSVAEEIILYRDIALSEYCGNRRYHAQHLSTEKSVEIVRDAKRKGLRVSCEVTPHHFILTEENLNTYNTNFKMNPPLRRNSDIIAIKKGLKDGTIDVIATDHAPHLNLEKDVEFDKAPNGIIGLETSLALSITHLVKDKWLTLNELIEKMSINPRKLLNIKPVMIEENQVANLTIFNPDEEWIVDKSQFKSKSRNTPFDKFKLFGKVKFVVNNHQIYQSTL
ncbi:MAG: dihydroorotase [Candidatus Kapaibacteriota bacterium]